MPILSIRVSEGQLDYLEDEANFSNMTVSEYVLSRCNLHSLDKLLLSDVIERAINLRRGVEFSIRDLYEKDEWEEFTRASKLSVGRIFYLSTKEGRFELSSKVEYLKKDSKNRATYRRI